MGGMEWEGGRRMGRGHDRKAHRVVHPARELVALVAIFVLVARCTCSARCPWDANPDLSDTQVIVYTDYPGQAPQVVEDQVTYPLLTTFLAVPKVKVVRGQSMFSSSFVYVIFRDGTDLTGALTRARISERHSEPAPRRRKTRPGRTPRRWAGCFSTRSRSRLLADRLRSIQDFQVRYTLQSVGRGRGREPGRLRSAIPSAARPGPAPCYGVTARESSPRCAGPTRTSGRAPWKVAGSELRDPRAGLLSWSRDIGKGRSRCPGRMGARCGSVT